MQSFGFTKQDFIRSPSDKAESSANASLWRLRRLDSSVLIGFYSRTSYKVQPVPWAAPTLAVARIEQARAGEMHSGTLYRSGEHIL
jgi:hypothetical protein